MQALETRDHSEKHSEVWNSLWTSKNLNYFPIVYEYSES